MSFPFWQSHVWCLRWQFLQSYLDLNSDTLYAPKQLKHHFFYFMNVTLCSLYVMSLQSNDGCAQYTHFFWLMVLFIYEFWGFACAIFVIILTDASNEICRISNYTTWVTVVSLTRLLNCQFPGNRISEFCYHPVVATIFSSYIYSKILR